ncbi:hypothetical protein H6F43_17120 [Leptolyngbya sp. FACHB-36]|nr:hypothetical protein [Leptolyngbya sp. FACHB-36]
MAYLINPILLNEYVANAHVDVFLCTTLIGLIGCLQHRRYVGAILAGVAGVLTKTLPLIWLPLVVGFLIKHRRWKALTIAAGITLLVIAGLSVTVLPTLDAWKSLLNPATAQTTARSLHHVLYVSLRSLTPVSSATRETIVAMAARLSFYGFILYAGCIYLRLFFKRQYAENDLVMDMGWITLVLFLFATPWLMPWYPTVLLSIAVLAPNASRFALVSLTFCLSAGAIVGPGSGMQLVSLVSCLLSVGVPIGVLLNYSRLRFLVQHLHRWHRGRAIV